ncbi:hypothetical protein Y1Q_0014572 [Alligator mississippiensis]|uniref:Uncharacterized protein n=1 Tax=Alligator mississippiensis TaxID=8496 RepID=A0A151PDA0_ALLMI|nr:hypothetical protein Y1Q_0014572 [Alligator mississippiensis]
MGFLMLPLPKSVAQYLLYMASLGILRSHWKRGVQTRLCSHEVCRTDPSLYHHFQQSSQQPLQARDSFAACDVVQHSHNKGSSTSSVAEVEDTSSCTTTVEYCLVIGALTGDMGFHLLHTEEDVEPGFLSS